MASKDDPTHWRAHGPYTGTNASKTGLLDETRQFLLTHARVRDWTGTREALVDTGLPQRSRATRKTIAGLIQQRLLRWGPPPWVLEDLIAFAQDPQPDSLRAALLLHVCRQDPLLYDVVQEVILPAWREGSLVITRADVQRFLDAAREHHPEIDRWSHTTREKLAGNLLSILRDYGLLQGTAHKQIVEPIVPLGVVEHLVRLLQAEQVAETELIAHPDWQLWLWDRGRVRAAIGRTVEQGAA